MAMERSNGSWFKQICVEMKKKSTQNSAQQHTPNNDNSVNSYVLSDYIIIDKIIL